MFFPGTKDYSKDGKETKTGLVIAKATCDGDIRVTGSGKEVGSISVIAYHYQDGGAAFLNVKGWGRLGRELSKLVKGDTVVAAGRLESREYNGKTYTDLVADFILPAGGEDKSGSFPLPPGTAVDVPADDFSEDEAPGELPF